MKTFTNSVCSALTLVLLGMTGCGKSSSKSASSGSTTSTANASLSISAEGSFSSPSKASLTALADSLFSLANANAGATSDPYAGVGVNSGESVVDGLKVYMTGISLQQETHETSEIVSWANEPKELQLAKGLTDTFNVQKDLYLKPGKYNQLVVNMKDKIAIKAWAYLDSNNDGTIDTTIYTTASAVKKVGEVLDPASMPTDYDYFAYGYINALASDSLTASTKTAMSSIIFDESIVVPEVAAPASTTASPTSTASLADSAASAPLPISINMVVDTTNLVKVWDGRFGASEQIPFIRGNGAVPTPQFPFPMGLNPDWSRSKTPGLLQTDFYPENKPAFGLSNYLPMFGFVNKKGLSYQTYAFSLDTDFNSLFAVNGNAAYRKTLIVTFALDGDKKPLFSRTTTLAEGSQLFIGAVGRLFEKQADSTYTFYTSYGETDASGAVDGGLYYHSDKNMAGHSIEGFKVLAAVGDTETVLQKNGPRCKAQYDYCVDAAAGKTLHVKRLK